VIVIAKISKIRVFIAIILIGVLSFSLFNSISGVVSAETGDVDISWTNVPPTIFQKCRLGFVQIIIRSKKLMAIQMIKKFV